MKIEEIEEIEEIESINCYKSFASDNEPNNKNHLDSKKQASASEENKLDEEIDSTTKISYFKLYSFADTIDTILIIIGTIAGVLSGLSVPILFLLFSDLIDAFGKQSGTNKLLDEVAAISLALTYLAIGSAVATSLRVICWTISSERQTWRIRNTYLKSVLRQEIALFDKDANTGKIIGRLSFDTDLIQAAIGEQMGGFIQSLSLFFGGYIIAFYQGWLLTLVMMATIPPLVIASAIMSRILTKFSSQEQAAYGEASSIVEQTISSIRTVASFNGEKRAVDRYNQHLKIAASKSVHQEISKGLSVGFAVSFVYFGLSLGVWYGGKLILNSGRYTGGKVINVIFSVLISSFVLGQISTFISTFSEGRVAGFKIFQTINRKPKIDSSDDSGRTLDNIRGDIELRNVVFSYPSRPNYHIFSGLSLYINSGMSTALVGESGSGKSTIISLIERFYDPQSGQVLIDGINLKDFKLRWIRENIGLVSQEPVLFSTTLHHNIAYGKDGATLEEIKTAVQLANAAKFIDKMPQGFETMVGENATQLSGGQKQRIAIARAILKDPKILLLDEATSALDIESERIVQDALDRVMKNQTTVIVAHRLSTVKNVDVIAVIHQGSIIEKGSHSELIIKPGGAYSKLIQLQEANKDYLCNTPTMGSRGSLSLELSMQGNSKRHSSNFHADIESQSKLQTQSKGPPNVSIKRLAYLNRPEIPALIVGTIFSILIGLIRPFYGLFIAEIISSFFKPKSKIKKETNFWALMFLSIALFTLITLSVRSYFFAIAGSKLVKRVRSMCFEKVVGMEIGWFDTYENSSGAIGTRLSKDANTVKSLVGDSLAIFVENCTILIAALIISLIASWQLCLIILVLVPLVSANIYTQMKLLKPILQDAKVLYEEASQIANDAVGNIRTVASFSTEEKVVELFEKKCQVSKKSGIRVGIISSIGYGITYFMLFSIFATIFYIGGRFVEDGKIEFVDVLKVFFILLMAFLGIFRNSSLVPDYINMKNATASVFAILDRDSKIDPGDDSGIVLKEVRGNIEFRHANFKYPTRPDVQIFLDFNFTIHSKKVTALVGESGCGKSTVISLLQRFYDLDSGKIFLDGNDIKGLKLQWLRGQMGLVSQEPVLFNDTIRANIAYGKEDEATESDIIASAEFANAHKFISALPEGYNTLVGERGIQLSGGQKQRVAIARAIVKEPKILLLDEATSALDVESEREVQDALEKVMVERTTIVVAHRLSTIKGVDMIAVVKDGSVVENGKHDVLINIKDGAYASLLAIYSTNLSNN